MAQNPSEQHMTDRHISSAFYVNIIIESIEINLIIISFVLDIIWHQIYVVHKYVVPYIRPHTTLESNSPT